MLQISGDAESLSDADSLAVAGSSTNSANISDSDSLAVPSVCVRQTGR